MPYVADHQKIDTAGLPAMLTQIPTPPRELYYRGAMLDSGATMIAIVGTRRATPAGLALAERLARELAEHGFSIVSGLAFGIDAAAHEGALAAGGKTIAVLPCGVDAIYPRSHVNLAERILKNGGTIVSEYPPGTEALPYRFLERNRIVSGLARGVVIIEAPARSGSLATARFAAEQGRDCFVVPGSITHPNYEGSHELIRKGAELITNTDHILEAYGMLDIKEQNNIAPHIAQNLSPDEENIFKILRTADTPLDIDKIIQHANLQPHVVNVAITMLLLKKVIQETAQGYMVS